MRKLLHSMSLWYGVFSVAAFVKKVGVREWAEDPPLLLAVFVVAATVNHLTQDE